MASDLNRGRLRLSVVPGIEMGRRVCPARAPGCARGRQPLPQCAQHVARQRKTPSYSQCVSQPQTPATESPVGGGTEAPAGVGISTPPGPDSSRPDVKVVDRRD